MRAIESIMVIVVLLCMMVGITIWHLRPLPPSRERRKGGVFKRFWKWLKDIFDLLFAIG